MSETNIPSEISDKIEAEAKVQATDHKGRLDQCVYDRTKEVLKIGYSLASKTIDEKDEEIRVLKTVMIAAAEEIQSHWNAHCDEEGYGPSSLLRRLEHGIPSEYGYAAGRFEEMKNELQQQASTIAALQADNERLKGILIEYYWGNIALPKSITPEGLQQFKEYHNL